jgi:DNA polymerase-3 subunit delta
LRISLTSLSGKIQQGFEPLYLLFGAEPLLIEETLDKVRVLAREQGYLERLRYTVEPGFDWNLILHQGQAMSLFAEKKLIELRIPTGKPGDAGSKALIAYSEMLPADTTLFVISGPVDRRSQKSKWFKAMDSAGVVTEVPAVTSDQLPDWIGQRMSGKGLDYEFAAVERLCHLVEGNLLAAAQEINLLGLLYADEKITVEIVDRVIADHARFDVYKLSDACLAGSATRATRILQGLKRERVEPMVILWALTRETRVLCQLSAESESTGRPVSSLFKNYGVWSNRTGLVSAALKRLSRPQWENILRRLGRADLMVKGSAPMLRRDIWEEIESISLGMCGLRIY